MPVSWLALSEIDLRNKKDHSPSFPASYTRPSIYLPFRSQLLNHQHRATRGQQPRVNTMLEGTVMRTRSYPKKDWLGPCSALSILEAVVVALQHMFCMNPKIRAGNNVEACRIQCNASPQIFIFTYIVRSSHITKII